MSAEVRTAADEGPCIGHADRMEAEVPACERYSITPADAGMLQKVAVTEPGLRHLLLREYAERHGVDALAGLFGEFIGLANRLATNAVEQAELILITEGNMHPHEAEKLNGPSVLGALEGIKLAARADSVERCGGCAFRLGSMANMSATTTIDARGCIPPGSDPFMCHENMDGHGNPTKACAGWAQARKKEHHDR